MRDTPLLEIRSLGKRFPARHGREPSPWVIQNLSFSVGAGEFLTIIGPSGAGKSTLLNMIAQIDTASAGEIVFNGETVNSHDARTLRPTGASAMSPRTTTCCRGARPSTTCCFRSRCRGA
jgi:ABC-type sugar transport system ATPase subunit